MEKIKINLDQSEWVEAREQIYWSISIDGRMATGERNALHGTVFPEVFPPRSYENEGKNQIFLLIKPILDIRLRPNDQKHQLNL